ncbi:MAG: MoaD/ThiS family protein [Chlamydiales bacterium]
MKKEIHIVYYALLRQERGRAQETLSSNASTARDLYMELQKQYGFKLSEAQIKVAINSAAASWDTVLNSGDTVLFIPPVAGG